MKVLFIDNFDSFTFNLVDEFEKRGCEIKVYRNNTDMRTINSVVTKFKPQLIVISPGPSTPEKAGNSIDIIKEYYEKIPIFGVCLGHQAITVAFGGKVEKAPKTVHGKPSKIVHDGQGMFKGIEQNFQAGRYHSLCSTEVPYCFEISARTEDKSVVMGIRHKDFPVIGVQFHPESVLTPVGKMIIDNLVEMFGK
jgi:anthranilate synthase/aminodeoxychorismate synthase-like glutamine amidotransferase